MSKVTAAMMMGAGLGTRMRPLTDDCPKPLVTVGGKTLIDHSIDRLVAAGVTLLVVNVHYKADMLQAHLSKRRDVEIVISDETDRLLDTGGGVVKAMPYFGDRSFFVLNSDSIWIEGAAPALPAMLSQWDDRSMDGLLLLAEMKTALGYEGTGDFALRPGSDVIRARDATGAERILAYPGVQIAHPRLFANSPPGAFSTNIMWDRAIAKGRLFGSVLDGTWIHVGTPRARDEAQATLAALSPA
ncbi:MAG TPA: nucleotidyltransferase family protein [Rhizomicrobium sp.]|nr:nucleotidyltransferase family protein [Rhizomicrobium sp.]